MDGAHAGVDGSKERWELECAGGDVAGWGRGWGEVNCGRSTKANAGPSTPLKDASLRMTGLWTAQGDNQF